MASPFFVEFSWKDVKAQNFKICKIQFLCLSCLLLMGTGFSNARQCLKPLAVRILLNIDEMRFFCDFLGNVSLFLRKWSVCRDLSIHHQAWQNNLLYPELKDRGPTCSKHSSEFLFQGKHRQCIKSCWVHTLLLLWPAGVTLFCPAWLSETLKFHQIISSLILYLDWVIWWHLEILYL